MSIASASRLRNEMCFCIICIDGHYNDDISGRIFNAYYRDAIEYDNTMEMIAKLEDIFNIFGYPHQTMELRRSFAKEHEHDDDVANKKSGHKKDGQNVDQNGESSKNETPEGIIRIGPRTAGDLRTNSGNTVKNPGMLYSQPGPVICTKNDMTADINSGEGSGIVMGRRLHIAPTTRLIKHNAKGMLATLKTRVMFRQNAEWQGNARWLEEDLCEYFSSVIELMMLIDSMF